MTAPLHAFTTRPSTRSAERPAGAPGAAGPAWATGPLPDPATTVRAGLPPFDFRVEGPDGWEPVHLGGGRSVAESRRIIAAQLGWTDLHGREQRQVSTLVDGLAAAAARSGVAVSLVKLGRDGASGELFVGSLSFAWIDARPVPADLPLARRVVGWTAPSEVLETPTGPAVLTTEDSGPVRGWQQLFPEGAATAQVYVPVPGTTWMCVVTAVLARRWADLGASLARRGALTLRAFPAGGPADRTAEQPPAPAGTPPAGTPPDGTAAAGTGPDGPAPDGPAPDGTTPDRTARDLPGTTSTSETRRN